VTNYTLGALGVPYSISLTTLTAKPPLNIAVTMTSA
jgi:hypothetical protein